MWVNSPFLFINLYTIIYIKLWVALKKAVCVIVGGLEKGRWFFF